MSFASVIGTLFGTSAGSAVSSAAAPITAIAGVLDRVLPDKAQNDAAKAQLLALEASGEIQSMLGQLQVDQAEAQSKSVFVAGWRPFIGWVCGFALMYEFVARPLLVFIFQHYHAIAPSLETGDLIGLVTTMLGMGALRTVDKVQGTSNGH